MLIPQSISLSVNKSFFKSKFVVALDFVSLVATGWYSSVLMLQNLKLRPGYFGIYILFIRIISPVLVKKQASFISASYVLTQELLGCRK